MFAFLELSHQGLSMFCYSPMQYFYCKATSGLCRKEGVLIGFFPVLHARFNPFKLILFLIYHIRNCTFLALSLLVFSRQAVFPRSKNTTDPHGADHFTDLLPGTECVHLCICLYLFICLCMREQYLAKFSFDNFIILIDFIFVFIAVKSTNKSTNPYFSKYKRHN